MKKLISLALAGAMAISLAACGGTATSEPAANSGAASTPAADGAATGTLKIGGIGPITGDLALYGQATQWGAEIAIEEINAMGGIQFEMKFEDDTGSEETAINAYNALKDWGANVIYGTTTSAPAISVAAETNADRYFQITASASSPAVNAGKDNVFQVCFDDTTQGGLPADWLKESGVGTKVGILYNSAQDYSVGLHDAFVARAKEIGLEIVAEEEFTDDATVDFSAQLTNLQSAGVDLVFLPIYYTPAYSILSAAKSMGYDADFFGCDGMDGILDIDGMDPSVVDGLLLLTPFNAGATDEKTASFVEKYQAAHEILPNQFAADGYDAMYALYQAVNKAGITGDMSHEDICEALIATMTAADFSFDGLTGAGMTWDANGYVSKSPLVFRIENGAYVAA